MMAPERVAGGGGWGARAVKVPTVRGVQESLKTMPIVLPPKKSKKKVPDFRKRRRCMEIWVPSGGLAIFWEATAPPLAPSLESRPENLFLQ